MMEQIQAEVAAIRSQIDALRQERASLTVNVVSPEDDSPSAIALAYRQYARENAQLSAEVKGIDDAIAALEAQLKNKQVELQRLAFKSKRLSLEQLEEGKRQAKIHAERINQLAAELAAEVRILKVCADQLSPSYWQVYYKPFITGFKTKLLRI